MAGLNFDASSVPPQEALEPVPSGWYICQIVDSSMEPTKNQQGSFLALELQILDGPYAGRKVFDRLNLNNANQVAQEIAYKTLSAICHAVGILQVADSQQLHGKPLEVKVSLRPAGPGGDGQHYEANNVVKGYRAVAGSTGNGAPPAPPAAPGGWAPPVPPSTSFAPNAGFPSSTPTASQNAVAGNPPAWTPPAPSATPVLPAPPAWTPPVAPPAAPAAWTPPTAPAQQQAPVVQYFVCDHCQEVISEYAKPATCRKCTCPNLTQSATLTEAQNLATTRLKGMPVTPAAPVVPPAPPAGVPATAPWLRKPA